MRDENHMFVARVQHLERSGEGVEPAREQQHLVCGKRRALRVEAEEGLLGYICITGGVIRKWRARGVRGACPVGA